jgi:protease-4
MATDSKQRGPLGWIGLFFKGIWLLLTRTALLFLTILFLLGIIGLFSVAARQEGPVVVTPNSVLDITLEGQIVEQADPLAELPPPFGSDVRQIVLRDLVRAISTAAGDNRIEALVLRFEGVGMSISEALSIQEAVTAFAESDKPVIAIGNTFGTASLMVASAADEVRLHKDGSVFLPGYVVQPLYFAELLSDLMINVEVFRVGEFKSAVEPFLRDTMSDEAEVANRDWASSLYNQAHGTIAQGRDLQTADLNGFVRNFPQRVLANDGDFAATAVAAGLVDAAESSVQTRNLLADRFGEDTDRVSLKTYVRDIKDGVLPDGDKVGIVYINGTITAGESEDGNAGAETVSKLLRRAAGDDNIKAVVVRVNSPGGSAFASEIMRNEIQNIQAQGKPVVVSMGTLAASGGYWVSAPADEIWAEPTTLTGSIGIFGLFLDLDRSAEEIGINSDGIKQAEWSDAFNPLTPFTPAARTLFQAAIEDGYNDFLSVVSEGRDIPVEEVDEIARGRVWIGEQARDLGLVDQLGGLEDAVVAAAERADLDEYETVVVKRRPSPFQQFLMGFSNAMAPDMVEAMLKATGTNAVFADYLSSEAELVRQTLKAGHPNGIYALCETCLAAERSEVRQR